MKAHLKPLVVPALLLTLIFASALNLVLERDRTRSLFIDLQALRKQKDELDREWGQLLLEQGTWGAHGRVEEIARSKLGMTVPTPEQIVRVRP
ncbi:MAG TPA: cell division protein FtsL [Gammaproteobacteria bacterium]|nr:cell division protein FtsL [Gammaproteobacteria bacterium]